MIYSTQLRRKKAATSLASMLQSNGPEIAKQLAPRMAAVLEEGEEMPDVAHLLDVIGRMLVLESEGVETASRTRSLEGTEVTEARRELRERAEPELRSRVSWVRTQMRNAYGAKEARRLLNHSGRTPRAREELKQMAENLVALLPLAELPKAMPGSPVKPADWADYLRPALTDFSRSLGTLQRHTESQAEVVAERNKALAIFDQNYSRVVRLTELFYELSGLDTLVKHLRHQPGRPAEQTVPEAGKRDIVAPETGRHARRGDGPPKVA